MKRTYVATAALAAGLFLGSAAPALADESGSIDHVEGINGVEQVLYSIAGLPDGTQPDLSSVEVTVNGARVDATATPASGGNDSVVRVAVLALDVSKSMEGAKFDEAKQAALAFIDRAPADVEIGLVTFAGAVSTLHQPTTDRGALSADIDGLELSGQTRLYEGVLAALSATGTEGQRRVLVLSDGLDTTRVPLSKVTTAVNRSGAQVDVVSLARLTDDRSPLTQIAQVGEGTLLAATDPAALTQLFADEAEALASQVLISFPVPTALTSSDADLTVALSAGGTTYTDAAFVSFGDAPVETPPAAVSDTEPLAVPQPQFVISEGLLIVGVGAVALVLMIGLAAMLGVFRREEKMTLERRMAGTPSSQHMTSSQDSRGSVKETAVALANKTISGRGFEAKLDKRLDAAGMSLKPAEWVLAHIGIAVGAAFVGFLLFSGSVLWAALLFIVGIVLPWVYLSFKRSRRIAAFNSQLGETMQLMSGALSAGLSLPQAIDTIMREGTEPIAGEFRRALVEARLGVEIEDALDGVADRMSSKDFQWVVMAVRIQREVGGNLAELLMTVSTTLREREFLRRQVRSLSAEGRLSALILCAMPPLFMVYLSLTRPGYLDPMFNTLLGIMMIAVGAVLMSVGAFWMSRVVKVEV